MYKYELHLVGNQPPSIPCEIIVDTAYLQNLQRVVRKFMKQMYISK